MFPVWRRSCSGTLRLRAGDKDGFGMSGLIEEPKRVGEEEGSVQRQGGTFLRWRIRGEGGGGMA